MLCTDFHMNDISAVGLDQHVLVCQLRKQSGDIGGLKIHLVNRHYKRNARGPSVSDRFPRLRHHTVVRSDYQHDDVGYVGATRARIAVNAS